MSREFLTPDSIRLGCDLYYGPITEYQMDPSLGQFYYGRYLPHFLECLEPGVVILVSLNWLLPFFRDIISQIKVPFVLVTGGYSDNYAPGNYKNSDAFSDEQNSKILHWYTTNCYPTPDSERFSCIPLGMNGIKIYGDALPTMEKFIARTVFAKDSSSYIIVPRNISYDIIISFSVSSNPRVRVGIWLMFCGGTPGEATSNLYTTPFLYTNNKNITALCFNRIKVAEAYDIITQNKFVVSPPGGGLDCFRTWETLLLGGYPIVVRSGLDEMYHNLPVLILDNWDDLTLELLAKARQQFESTKFTYESLYTSYYTLGLFRRFGYSQYKYERFNLDDDYVLQFLNRTGIAEGDLIKGEQNAVYLVRNHQRCPISEETFQRMQLSFLSVKRMSDVMLNEIPIGPNVI